MRSALFSAGNSKIQFVGHWLWLQKYKPIVEKKRKTPSAVFETQLGKSPKEIHSSKIKKLKKKERNILLKSVKLRKDIDVMTH